jgi:hypothetical protein
MTKLFYVTRVSAQKKIGSKYDAIILFVFSPSWEYLRQLERDYPDQILIKESLRTLRTKKRQPEQRRWKTNNFSRRPSEGHNAESRSNQFEVHSTSHHFDWNLVDVARRSGHELFKTNDKNSSVLGESRQQITQQGFSNRACVKMAESYHDKKLYKARTSNVVRY